MQYFVLVCVLYLLFLQRAIIATSFSPFPEASKLDAGKVYAVRRLRAPLMGRSALLVHHNVHNDDDDDGGYSMQHQSNNGHEDELPKLRDQRLLWELLNRRSSANSRKKGPLFG